jgi:hypothetical protein
MTICSHRRMRFDKRQTFSGNPYLLSPIVWLLPLEEEPRARCELDDADKVLGNCRKWESLTPV